MKRADRRAAVGVQRGPTQQWREGLVKVHDVGVEGLDGLFRSPRGQRRDREGCFRSVRGKRPARPETQHPRRRVVDRFVVRVGRYDQDFFISCAQHTAHREDLFLDAPKDT